MKKFFIGLTMLSVVAGSTLLSGCKCEKEPPEETEGEAQGYVSLDINPSIELVVDENGKVLNVYGTNEDAQVLLYNETGIVGVDVETAIAKITTLAKELGFLTDNNDVVSVLSSGIDTKLLNSITTTITTTAQNLGLSVTTDSQGAYSLVREFEAYKQKSPNNSAIQNLTISKYKLALSVAETGNVTLDAAVLLDDSQLIDMLDSNLEKVEIYMTDEFNKAKVEAENIFEQAKLLAEDTAYITYFSSHLLQDPLNSYHGALYMMYHSTGKGFELIANTIEKGKQLKTHQLDATQIQNIATSLGMEEGEIDKLKNENGQVTIDSVEEYVDQLFKDNSQDWTQVKTSLDATLDSIESSVDTVYNEVKDTFYPQIEGIINQANSALTTLKNIKNTLSVNPLAATLVTELEGYINDYEAIVNDIKTILNDDGLNLDVEELKGKATSLLEKASEIKTDMEATLSEDAKTQIETLKQTAVDALTVAKQTLQTALTNAENSAKTTLNNLKQQRKNNK